MLGVLHPLDRRLGGVDPRLDPARGDHLPRRLERRGGSTSRGCGRQEQLKGGYASGPVSFMRGARRVGGDDQVGGKTRRAAKMVVLDVDHPDVDEFIWCKAREERKARVLEQAGYDMSLDSADWASIQYQNANNSVRVTDAFMEAVSEGKGWALTARTDGPSSRLSTRARRSSRPGRPHGNALTWASARHDDQRVAPRPIRVASTRRTRAGHAHRRLGAQPRLTEPHQFRREDGEFDVEMFEHAVDVVFLAQEILVGYSSYPTPEIGGTPSGSASSASATRTSVRSSRRGGCRTTRTRVARTRRRSRP